MHLAHSLIRIYVLFVAASGFLFGQVFFGNFALPATLAGLSGVIAGSFASRNAAQSRGRNLLVIGSCMVGLIGVGMDATNYYAHLAVPGNYYAWFLIGPFCVGLVVLGLSAWKALPSRQGVSATK